MQVLLRETYMTEYGPETDADIAIPRTHENRSVITVSVEPLSMGILEDKARARIFYRYLSKVYDRVNPFVWTEEMRAEALEMFDPDRGERVLDVGCGTGFGTAGLLQYTDDVHGLDQSVHQMEKAFEKFGRRGRVHFYRGDAEHLPFRNGVFDALWSSGSIEYWPDPVATLRECRRVVRPGGAVLVVGPHRPDSWAFRKVANAIMLFYDEADADRMFREAGFADIEHRLMGPWYEPEIAIATLARVPGNEEGVNADEVAEPECGAKIDTETERA